MFGGGGFGQAPEGPGRQRGHLPPTGATTPSGSGASHHPPQDAAPPSAAYYQLPNYQQWGLPAQFAQFALGGYPGVHQHHNGATYYAPPHAGRAVPGTAPNMPHDVPQGFGMPGGMPGMQLPMQLPPEAGVPRGWGGMQLAEQQDHARGAYPGSRCGRVAGSAGRGCWRGAGQAMRVRRAQQTY